MSSHCPVRTLVLGLIAVLPGCHREDRQDWSDPHERAIPAASPDTVFPGGARVPPPEAQGMALEHKAHAIANGQQLFTAMNCGGCHSHGGGGMGPALMDDKWLYGGRIDQIAASIMEGRPNGMPSWRGKLTDQQMWQLAAYVRSLSGQVPKDAVSARADELSNTPPQTQTKREPVRPAPPAQQ
jgi:cytochrome c oxidase cbb3-type subunit III